MSDENAPVDVTTADQDAPLPPDNSVAEADETNMVDGGALPVASSGLVITNSGNSLNDTGPSFILQPGTVDDLGKFVPVGDPVTIDAGSCHGVAIDGIISYLITRGPV